MCEVHEFGTTIDPHRVKVKGGNEA